jgi:hypothetical protein
MNYLGNWPVITYGGSLGAIFRGNMVVVGRTVPCELKVNLYTRIDCIGTPTWTGVFRYCVMAGDIFTGNMGGVWLSKSDCSLVTLDCSRFISASCDILSPYGIIAYSLRCLLIPASLLLYLIL